MSSETEKYMDQLYCLIVSQLLHDGHSSLAKTLTKTCNLNRYGRILGSNELFDVVFNDEAYIPTARKNPLERKLKIGDKDEMRYSALPRISEEMPSGQTTDLQDRAVVSCEPSADKTALKKVKMKRRFNYSEDSPNITVVYGLPVQVEGYEIHEATCERGPDEALKGLVTVPSESDTMAILDEKSTDKYEILQDEVSQTSVTSVDTDNTLMTVTMEAKVPKVTGVNRRNSSAKLCCYCNTHEANLSKHILENHATKSMRGFKCNMCGKLIQKKLFNINEHLKTHSDAKHFLCPDCGVGFKRAAALKNHMETVHLNSNFECDVCGKVLRSHTAFRAHQYTHTKEYNLPCRTCGKCFRYSRDLANHELTHTGAKPHKCSMCHKEFRTHSQVLRHEKQQHGTSTIYKCGLCPYRVNQKCNLKIHMKRHTGVKYGELFVCPFCYSGFPDSDLLEEHSANECIKIN